MDLLTEESSPETHAVIGAALRVHQLLGPGFLEAVYQESLAIELRRRGVPFRRELPIAIRYDGEPLASPYRADFLAWEGLLLELKAISSLGRIEEAQLLHYLRATDLTTGLLLNFGSTSLQVRRMTNRRPVAQGIDYGSP
jgi:GxxExxY protein